MQCLKTCCSWRRADGRAILSGTPWRASSLNPPLRPACWAGVSGDVRLGGRRVGPADVRAAAGYVPQDDVLPGTSTVWEFLALHAALRLPGGAGRGAAGAARARALLRQLSLAKVASFHKHAS